MKNMNSEKKTVPVPARGKECDERDLLIGRKIRGRKKRRIFAIAGTMLAAASVAVLVTASNYEEMPILLSNGEVITPPVYITVNDKKVALVESEEIAEDVMKKVIDEYDDSENELLDIEVTEDTGIEKMELKLGDDPPEILTREQAEEALMEGNSGESYITVVTTEETVEQESIEFDEEYKPEPTLYVGESQVETEGKEGTKEITKKITKENGAAVEEEVVEEQIIEEPVQQIVLTGTKAQEGYGGGDGNYGDDNVSRNEEATYDILRTPVEGFCVTSPFGPRWGSLHTGIDLALAQGNPIYAADDGTVYFSGCGGGYGNLVKIDHGNGMQTYYAHCSKLLVSEGEQVEMGQEIALVGTTGNSTGPHLHFEVIINGNCVDPADFLALEE